ncbi:MAG: outer membrane protein assembly factor BamA [Gammaproteobacteria bacterium]|nr:outer membrane protein assembly factor BamA [Gammaproteobacteria bacterium]
MKFFYVILFFFSFIHSAFAFESFQVKDIKLEGLQRISIGTVFNYLPIKPGDKIDKAQVENAIRVLYKTGFFKDIHIEREANVLVIFVAERPAINNIELVGYDTISKDQLNSALKQTGLVKGQVFNRSILEGLQQELQRQYYSLGKYNIKIDIEKTQLERNRVDIKIKISEGKSAEIYTVNIVGNKQFSTEELISKLSVAETSFFGSRNNYQKQQLAADLETLKSFYQDRGYLNFNIESTQVSLGPEKESVYITININEGDRFTVRDVKLAGELILEPEVLAKLISIKANDIFSRREVVESNKRISDLLAENGYAFANVNMNPDIDNDSRTLALTFFVDPGKRIYVKRVNITGNSKTKDKVIRRELRQLESDWLSTAHVARSKTRLDRLGYFESVGVQTVPIPGFSDQVNLDYAVTEKPTGSLQAGLGYSDTQGPVVNLAVTQDNFLGTGQLVSLNLDNSSVTKQYSFNYVNPYYTDAGVSRNISLSYQKVDAAEAEISNYTTDSYGASMSFAVPMSEFMNYNWGIKYDSTKITTSSSPSKSIVDFINNNGALNRTYQLSGSWSYDSRNRRIFATEGTLSSLGAEIAVPGGDLEYYKLNLRQLNYVPLGKDVTFAVNLSLGYGETYGKTTDFPPYENYFAGGSSSVRGYDANSLGPKDKDIGGVTNDPVGGKVKAVGNMDLILPNPFTDQSSSTRLSLFVDAGAIYRDSKTINSSEFRYTAGIAFIWITPVGALRFNFAEPLNPKPGDLTSVFQFSLGSPFF